MSKMSLYLVEVEGGGENESGMCDVILPFHFSPKGEVIK